MSQEFINAMRAAGLDPPVHIVPGRCIRFPGVGKGSKNKAGWCRLFDDMRGGVFGDYSSDLYSVWQEKCATEYTKAERAEFMRKVEANRKQQVAERDRAAVTAAKKAGWILKQTKLEPHAYMDAHGMPEELVNVWRPNDKENLMVVPMRAGRELVGCQLIDRDGNKKFLTGQRTKGAEYLIDGKGMNVWCEGYATGLAIRLCLHAMRIRYRIHVCFSANNMLQMADAGFVIADNDHSGTGEKAAIATGLPYYLPAVIGDDFSDEWRGLGTLNAGMILKQHLIKVRHG